CLSGHGNSDLRLQMMLPRHVAGMQYHPAAGCWNVWILQGLW
ncbi:hypothetical protein A2U01_0065135, partial [Trifolium medium]|nr:hypothetical protein [Trifolium medium]